MIQPIPPDSSGALSEINSVWFYRNWVTVINTTVSDTGYLQHQFGGPTSVICDIANRKWNHEVSVRFAVKKATSCIQQFDV